jgi:hypothetical protein
MEMSPIPTMSEHHHDNGDDREKAMRGEEWLVEAGNYREVGEAIASFNHRIGNDSFIGTAEMTVVEGVRKLEIVLICDENERYRCQVCEQIPTSPTPYNPAVCTFCGIKVCERCHRVHDKGHWRP